jgi:hypothetical protein
LQLQLLCLRKPLPQLMLLLMIVLVVLTAMHSTSTWYHIMMQ